MATILIVDDMAIFREPIAEALGRHGYQTASASDGTEALGMIASHRPDLIILDMSMPGMGGIEFMKALHAQAQLPRIPIFLLTATQERAVVLEARALGARGGLHKNQFSLDSLLTSIAKILGTGDQTATGQQPGTDRAFAQDSAIEGPRPSPPPASGSTASMSTRVPDDPAEALKSLKAVMARSDIVEHLDACGDIKALSPTIAEILRLTNSESATAEHITKVIRRDHAIAVKILKLANSAIYSRGAPVESLHKAVLRIGTGAIRQAVINISVVDQFNSVSIDGMATPLQFWEHSIGCGIIAAEIARALGDKEPDTAFTMGLLHDIGRLAFAQQFGEQYSQVFRTAQELQLPLEQVEKRLLSLNHADGMDRILHSWKFPKNLIDPIVFHHLSLGNLRRVAPRRIEAVATLALANRLAHALILGTSGNEVLYATESFCQHLTLSPEVIKHIEETAEEKTTDVKFVMLSAVNEGSCLARREEHRATLSVPFRPIYVSAAPQFDAFRIFCDQLTERTDEPPNIVIMHLTDSRERAPLTSALCQAESQAGVSGLPLVILSPTGKLKAEQSLLADRQHECLPTPVAVARLLASFRRFLEKPASAKAA